MEPKYTVMSKGSYVSSKILNGIDVFRELNDAQRERLASCCRCRRYDAEQRIVYAGERLSNAFFIISGSVQIVAFTGNGQQVTLRDLSAGEMFGETVVIGGYKHDADVTAHAETLIAVMSAYDFREAFLCYPSVAKATLKMLLQITRQFYIRILQMSSEPCRNRLQAELLRLSKPLNSDANKALISPAPKHYEMASYTGMRRETVSRELSRLRQAGLLERRGRDLVLNDIAYLNQSLEGRLN